MKRVAIVINSLKNGGAEKQAVLLGRILAERYEVKIIVMRPAEGMSEKLLALIAEADVDVLVLGIDGRRGGVRGLCDVFREWKPDSVFCYLTYANLAGAVAGRICGVGEIWQGLRNAYIPERKIPAEWYANRLSTGAVLNNHAGLDFFGHRGFRNIRVIENCFPDVRPPRKRPEGELVRIVTAARFVRQKDYPASIEAFALALRQIPRLRYRIIGHGEEEAAIRKIVSDKGIADRVEIIVNPVDVSRLVDECDIYLSTSRWEGTSNSIMEAMDASLPVVATDAGDNNRLVEEGRNGFIRSVGDVEGIAACLVELACSPELRNEMGVCGNQMLRERYGEGAFAAKYFALLGCD